MKRTLIALALCAIATAAGAATLEENIDRTFDARPGARFSLENTNGRITIHSWDQPRIKVHALKHVESRDASAAKDRMKELRVDMTPSGGGLEIVTRTPRNNGWSFWDLFTGGDVSSSVTYDVTVPRNMDLRLANVNGNVEVSEVSGVLKVETTNGRIELSRCGGQLDAETTNGGIRAELLQVANGPTTLETTNGRISLAVPATLAARVDAETTNGSIDTQLPVTTTHTGRSSLRGTINGGGPDLRLRTTNGGIEIRAIGGKTGV